MGHGDWSGSVEGGCLPLRGAGSTAKLGPQLSFLPPREGFVLHSWRPSLSCEVILCFLPTLLSILVLIFALHLDALTSHLESSTLGKIFLCTDSCSNQCFSWGQALEISIVDYIALLWLNFKMTNMAHVMLHFLTLLHFFGSLNLL